MQAEDKSQGPGADIGLVVSVRQEWWRAGQDQTGPQREMMFCSKSHGKQRSPRSDVGFGLVTLVAVDWRGSESRSRRNGQRAVATVQVSDDSGADGGREE